MTDDEKETEKFALERRNHFSGMIDIYAYRGYKNAFGNYLRRNNAGSDIEEIKSLSIGSDPNGGFTTPPNMSDRIAQLIAGKSPLRRFANVITIGFDAFDGVTDLNEATHGWVGEALNNVETKASKICDFRIPTHEQYAELKATQKLLDDPIFNMEEWLAIKISDRMAQMENQAFVSGNGVKKPRGFLTYPAGMSTSLNFCSIEQVTTGADGGFAERDPCDALINLIYSLKSVYRGNAVFMMKRATLAEVRKLKDGKGNYLWQPDFQQKEGGTLLGFNVIENEDMPAIGANSLSIAFGDFNAAYQIVDRQGICILRDGFTAKPYVKFYTTKRVGGDVVNFEAIKILKFSAN